VVGILALLSGCDKDRARREAANVVRPVGTPAINIYHRPTLLFQVFGDRGDPRVLPVAAIIDSAIVGIGLSEYGWKSLDSMYFAAGDSLFLYHGGQAAGRAAIVRGMWTKDGPLQTLPGCTAMRPIATVRLATQGIGSDSAIELLATNKALVTRGVAHEVFPQAEIDRIARAAGHDLGALNKIENSELDSLDFSARALSTGATGGLTLASSFVDPGAGDLGPGAGHSTNVLALLDFIDGKWQPTYRHVASGEARTVEFQRLLDHVDLDGDGTDEVILESWRYAAPNELVVLRFRAGQWHESLRVPLGWCMDSKKP